MLISSVDDLSSMSDGSPCPKREGILGLASGGCVHRVNNSRGSAGASPPREQWRLEDAGISWAWYDERINASLILCSVRSPDRRTEPAPTGMGVAHSFRSSGLCPPLFAVAACPRCAHSPDRRTEPAVGFRPLRSRLRCAPYGPPPDGFAYLLLPVSEAVPTRLRARRKP